MFNLRPQSENFSPPSHNRNTDGFSLVECLIALVILMVVSLSVVFVFDYSFRNNVSAKKRFGALVLAEQRLEEVRNTTFINLTAGTVTENSVVSDGLKYKVVRTITNNDLITDSTAPGPETKLITITVTPFDSSVASDGVTITTVRAVNRPGPNRQPNNP
jgi:prepilin-type N-terminal cleavage/methylation domain-containing protein